MMHERRSVIASAVEENGPGRPYRMTTTLTTSQKAALHELAAKHKVSVAWLIREAIDRFIEEAGGGPKLPFDVR